MAFVSNEEFETAEMEKEGSPAEENQSGQDAAVQPRKLFAYWKVGDETYRLKLRTEDIMSLEHTYKRNLLSLMGDSENNMPPLTTMLQITHAAMSKWHHGIKLQKVRDLYEQYISEGGSQLEFYVEVFMQIYVVSGFFSPSMAEDISDTMEETAAKM